MTLEQWEKLNGIASSAWLLHGLMLMDPQRAGDHEKAVKDVAERLDAMIAETRPEIVDGTERRAAPRTDMANPLRLDDLPPAPTSPEKTP